MYCLSDFPVVILFSLSGKKPKQTRDAEAPAPASCVIVSLAHENVTFFPFNMPKRGTSEELLLRPSLCPISLLDLLSCTRTSKHTVYLACMRHGTAALSSTRRHRLSSSGEKQQLHQRCSSRWSSDAHQIRVFLYFFGRGARDFQRRTRRAQRYDAYLR